MLAEIQSADGDGDDGATLLAAFIMCLYDEASKRDVFTQKAVREMIRAAGLRISKEYDNGKE